MKMWLTSILLLIVVTATLCPCYAKDDCYSGELLSGDSNHGNHKSDDNCSPFVTCGACQGFTINVKFVEIPIITVEKPVHHSRVIFLLLATYSSSLFQPPRAVQ